MHRSPNTDAIKEQVLILQDLKNAPYLSKDYPKIPFCDFKLIAKQVTQERKRKKNEIKWQKFLSYSDKKSDNVIIQDLNNINYLKNNSSIIFDESLDVGLRPNLIQEEIQYADFSAITKGLEKSDLYFILKKVKRERKKIQDEENWQNFNEMILKKEMKRETYMYDNNIDNTIIDNISKNHEFQNVCCTCRSAESIIDEDDKCSLNDKTNTVNDTYCDIAKFNEIKKEIISLIKNINDLLRNKAKSLPTDHDLKQMEKQASQFTTRFKRGFMKEKTCLVRNFRNITKNSQDMSTVLAASKFINDFEKFLQALKVIERELKKNYFIKPIKELLCSYFNESYSLIALNKYFYGYNDNEMDVENLLLDSLQLLQNTTVHDENIPIPEKGKCKEMPDEPQTPLWKKESVALARIKFGPPNKIRNKKLEAEETSKQQENSEEVEMDTLSICSSLHKSSKSLLNGNHTATRNSRENEKEKIAKVNGLRSLDTLKSREKRVGNNESSLIEEIDKKKLGDTEINKESFTKIIAKKIQEISGVDYELRKVEDVRIKMMSILLNIKVSISKNFNSHSLTNDENYERIQLRTIEFGARFKRNYLYRTKCQLNELKTIDANLFLINKKSKILNILQKICVAHQGILQSLQVIEKQLQTISASGLTQEVFFTFYCYIYELTFKLKKFYGFTHSQVLDDVEKLVVETIKLLKELKHEQEVVKLKKPAKATEKKISTKTKQGKPTKKNILIEKKSPYATKLVKKASKQSVNKNVEKPVEENKEEKGFNFMMNIKQRQGAPVRIRQNLNHQDPMTMVEMLAEHEPILDNLEPLAINSQKRPQPIYELEADMTPISSNEIVVPQMPGKIVPEHKKDTATNVKLITIKRMESSDDEIEKSNKYNKHKGQNFNQFWNGLNEYKAEFTKYKNSNPLYSKESLQTVKSLTEKLMDEALFESLTKVLNTINLQDISALKNVIEEEIK